ncbi:hypothetical protein SAMN02983003_1077 [Devosia enhydra]|uniref:Uncharacterized protein n=1 Tax=Devosia enhydra TaxID=665118 RepID=A0A1K2HWJ8_9HYPH|nr:hypothetical protein SAMN02983003_1077 [Devosia enhydra]
MKKRRRSARIKAYSDFALDERESRLRQEGVIYRPINGRPKTGLSQQEQKSAIARVVKLMSEWRASPFEHEAACVNGLRSQLCLDSVPWHPADTQAREIVGAAERELGLKRPTWSEGQPEHIASHDNCAYCAAPLSDDQIAHGDRFCSSDCARSVARRIRSRDSARHCEVLASARRVVQISRRPESTCKCCGKTFRPRGGTAAPKYCSEKCMGIAKRTMPEAICANPDCGKTFRLATKKRLETQRFCSKACVDHSRRRHSWLFERDYQCQICGSAFRSTHSAPRYCSNSCNILASRWSRGISVPKKVTPRALDYFVLRPAEAARPKWLSPARFDELAERGGRAC